MEINDALDYAATLCVDNRALASVDSLVNILNLIDADLDKVGFIFFVEGSSVFMAVDPSVAKNCSQLLPRKLPCTGVTVSHFEF